MNESLIFHAAANGKRTIDIKSFEHASRQPPAANKSTKTTINFSSSINESIKESS